MLQLTASDTPVSAPLAGNTLRAQQEPYQSRQWHGRPAERRLRQLHGPGGSRPALLERASCPGQESPVSGMTRDPQQKG